MGAPADRRALVGELARRHGLQLVGITSAAPLPSDLRRMRESLAAGRMARMDWMGGERPALATAPRRHLPEARAVAVFAAPYASERERAKWDPEPDALERALAPVLRDGAAGPAGGGPLGRIARYAVGTDYHLALRERLAALAEDLRGAGIGASPRSFVDDRPLAERGLAARAGVGWIGKNTNLLTHDRAGSWVLLGELLLTERVAAGTPLRSSCGSCTRCLTGCPTGALIAPRTIDARRCISYLTIEHPGRFSTPESAAIGSWLFGCDVCQEVCPVNGEADDRGAFEVPVVPLIEWLAPLGGRAFQRAVARTALRRATRHRLLRNALATLANAARADVGSWPSPTRDAALRAARLAVDDSRPEVRAEAGRAVGSLTLSSR